MGVCNPLKGAQSLKCFILVIENLHVDLEIHPKHIDLELWIELKR